MTILEFLFAVLVTYATVLAISVICGGGGDDGSNTNSDELWV